MARVRAGATIILTTHILEVAERLADRIGIIQHGRLIAEGTLAQLRQQAFTGKLANAGGVAQAADAAATLEDVFLDLTGQQTEQQEQAA